MQLSGRQRAEEARNARERVVGREGGWAGERGAAGRRKFKHLIGRKARAGRVQALRETGRRRLREASCKDLIRAVPYLLRRARNFPRTGGQNRHLNNPGFDSTAAGDDNAR